MTLRFGNLYEGGVYHVFNRGVDKRVVFSDARDKDRFMCLLDIVNSTQNIGSMIDFGIKQKNQSNTPVEPLVEIIAYNLQDNHYHLLIKQKTENGVSKFMHKLSMGYTKYFNVRNDRSGALFQGKYKYIEVKNDQQIMRLICYINNNDAIHQNRHPMTVNSRGYYLKQGQDSLIKSQAWRDLFGNYLSIERSVIKQTLNQRRLNSSDMLE